MANGKCAAPWHLAPPHARWFCLFMDRDQRLHHADTRHRKINQPILKLLSCHLLVSQIKNQHSDFGVNSVERNRHSLFDVQSRSNGLTTPNPFAPVATCR